MKTIYDHQGMGIRLTDERLAHILEHPERIMESLSDPKARLYYRFYVGTMVGDKFLCVVVKIVGEEAFVLTAYLTDRIKRGVLIWPKEI